MQLCANWFPNPPFRMDAPLFRVSSARYHGDDDDSLMMVEVSDVLDHMMTRLEPQILMSKAKQENICASELITLKFNQSSTVLNLLYIIESPHLRSLSV